MKIVFLVPIDIKLADDLPDPEPGDPLFERMRNSARAAVENMVENGIGNGCNHDMEDITSIQNGDITEQGDPIKS